MVLNPNRPDKSESLWFIWILLIRQLDQFLIVLINLNFPRQWIVIPVDTFESCFWIRIVPINLSDKLESNWYIWIIFWIWITQINMTHTEKYESYWSLNQLIHLNHTAKSESNWYIWTAQMNVNHTDASESNWYIWTMFLNLDHPDEYESLYFI